VVHIPPATVRGIELDDHGQGPIERGPRIARQIRAHLLAERPPGPADESPCPDVSPVAVHARGKRKRQTDHGSDSEEAGRIGSAHWRGDYRFHGGVLPAVAGRGAADGAAPGRRAYPLISFVMSPVSGRFLAR